MLRRRPRTLPEALEAPYAAFLAQAERLQAARRALLSCLPVGRVDPLPVPVGLDLLADEVRELRDAMDAWRVPPLEAEWRACRAAMDEALDALPEAHRVAASSTELEELLGAVADVHEPLDAWGAAERTWRRQHVRGEGRSAGGAGGG